MKDDEDEDKVLEDNRWGQEEVEERNNVLFMRTMLMSLIGWISSTGTCPPPSPVNPSDTLFGLFEQ
jgi:hypothetical protein